jgi:O-methyltransferase
MINMTNRFLNTLLNPLRLAARRFVMLPPVEKAYTGPHGCLRTAAQFVTWNQIPGDYCEFGVSTGDSFAAAYHAISGLRRKHGSYGLLAESNSPEFRRWLDEKPRFIAFDSFEGLPPGTGERHADYTVGAFACGEDDFRRNIAQQNVDLSEVITVKGFYDQTLNEETKKRHQISKVAIAMVDCDLYESTVPVLDFLTEVVQQGTIIIFDDWFRFRGSPKQGEQRAFREWEKKNPHLELIEYWREGPQAVSFLVNFR